MSPESFNLVGVVNFSPAEFRCKCKGRFCDGWGLLNIIAGIDSELLLALEELRYSAGQIPLRIVSGLRCPGYNRSVGGAERSQHLLGKAADIWCPDEDRQHELYIGAIGVESFRDGGIGRYNKFMHVDVRGHRARWDSRT